MKKNQSRPGNAGARLIVLIHLGGHNMKKYEVKVGSRYAVKIGGRLTTVVILAEVERGYRRNTTHWRARNLSTGREVEIKSATKLICEVKESPDVS